MNEALQIEINSVLLDFFQVGTVNDSVDMGGYFQLSALCPCKWSRN